MTMTRRTVLAGSAAAMMATPALPASSALADLITEHSQAQAHFDDLVDALEHAEAKWDEWRAQQSPRLVFIAPTEALDILVFNRDDAKERTRAVYEEARKRFQDATRVSGHETADKAFFQRTARREREALKHLAKAYEDLDAEREELSQVEDEYDRAIKRLDDALTALARYPAQTMVEAREKARYLLSAYPSRDMEWGIAMDVIRPLLESFTHHV